MYEQVVLDKVFDVLTNHLTLVLQFRGGGNLPPDGFFTLLLRNRLEL